MVEHEVLGSLRFHQRVSIQPRCKVAEHHMQRMLIHTPLLCPEMSPTAVHHPSVLKTHGLVEGIVVQVPKDLPKEFRTSECPHRQVSQRHICGLI